MKHTTLARTLSHALTLISRYTTLGYRAWYNHIELDGTVNVYYQES